MKMSGSGYEAFLSLSREYSDPPVNLNVKRYTRFCVRMDRQLNQLVNRWTRLAVPSATALQRTFDEKPVK